MKPRLFSALSAGAALIVLAPAPALAATGADDPETIEDLRDLSIEQLAQLEVTSASKQAEPIGRAPTSGFAIDASPSTRTATNSAGSWPTSTGGPTAGRSCGIG